MHPRTTELLELLGRSRATLRAAVEAVPEAARSASPGPGRWSAAEVLDHLSKVEGSVAHLLTARIAEARGKGLGFDPETTPVVDETFLSRLQNRGTTIEAAGSARPGPDVTWDAAWSLLEESRGRLVAVLEDSGGLALGDLSFPHRAFGTLNFYQWVVFVAGHEMRHAAQIRRIAEVAVP